MVQLHEVCVTVMTGQQEGVWAGLWVTCTDPTVGSLGLQSDFFWVQGV